MIKRLTILTISFLFINIISAMACTTLLVTKGASKVGSVFAAPYYTCDITRFSQKSAWWVFNFVANWAAIKYSYIIKDIQHKQDEIEKAEINGMKTADTYLTGEVGYPKSWYKKSRWPDGPISYKKPSERKK